ncbi:flagellar motor switch protein FliG [Jatrophihabitans endophyticus]|uniref:Flagellar motor switch protein FliG n=1 Tax=Jatrophihabitans endophyticus TaxID=1206085 RepID=A0A1M5IF27_9ACTN|nr:flagellar motor switch protein FliG [Jatrophihabitans endophyticus]SHG26948.1 flagellar motor switch protein FliG [Jatrophihabitans endophyticus]
MTVLAFPGNATAPTTEVEALPVGLNPRQKAAVLVLQLGREESARVLAELTEAELEALSIEIARLGTVAPGIAASVLDEFAYLLDDIKGGQARGGMDAAMNMLTASVGVERAMAIVDRVSHNFVEMPFTFLQKLDHRQIVSFLADEHPQTIALVLAHLPATIAAPILAGLNRDLQASVAHRIAVMDRTSPELIRQVEQSLERRLSSMGVRSDLSTVGGLRPLVDIINRADRATERMIIDGLEELDSGLAERVRSQMFMFEDIVGLEDRAIQLVVRQVPVNELAIALKGVSDTVRAKVMQNMSERSAQGLTEELDVLGPTRVHVVEEAQAAVVRVIRQLEESGEITVGRGEEDAFVA